MSWKQCVPGGSTVVHILWDIRTSSSSKVWLDLVKPKHCSADAESVGLLLACSPQAVRAGSWLLLSVCLCHLEHTSVCFLGVLKWELSAWPSQTLLN